MKIQTLKQAADAGYTFRWEDDWGVGSHINEFGADIYESEPDNCESLILLDPEGDIVASLGCVDDASDEYRRELETDMLGEISEPDTYATEQIDRITAEEIKTTDLYPGDDSPRYALSIRADHGVVSTKWMSITPEELTAIRAILARRTV